MPAYNKTYIAQWRTNNYSITFDDNGGIGGFTTTKPFGSVLVAPDVSKEGYSLIGWETEVPTTVPATDAVYVAQWGTKQYLVTFDDNGGSGGWSRRMEYNAPILQPTVVKEGHTFRAWYP
jgi:hypothetical protein